jgi:hypothetical protein
MNYHLEHACSGTILIVGMAKEDGMELKLP